MKTIIKVCTGVFLFFITLMGTLFCFSLIHRTAIKNGQKPLIQISSIIFISTLVFLI